MVPNPYRTVAFTGLAQSGSFAPYNLNDEDVLTFDLTGMLIKDADGVETVTSIVSTMLAVSGPSCAVDPAIVPPCVTDPTPQARIISAAVIQGNQVSLQLGNWQPNIPYIQYSITLIFLTSFGNQRTVVCVLGVTQA